MSVIALSTQPQIQSWQLDHNNADLNIDGILLVGNAAAAYLFGQALRTIDLSVFGAMGNERFTRQQALLEFPPGSGNRVSLTEISDALRYKYSIDPLVEFSSSIGLTGYSLADVNGILSALNQEYGHLFALPLLDRPAASETVSVTQDLPAAPLSELLDAAGRQALVDLAQRLRTTLVSAPALLERLNTAAGISLDEALFPNPPGSVISGRALLATFSAKVGVNMADALPDFFADDALNFRDVNTLLAAAREAAPASAASLAGIAVPAPVFVGATGQRYVGGQAVLGYLGQALSSLNAEGRNGKYFNVSDAVLANPFNRVNSETLSITEVAGQLKAQYGIDVAPLLAQQGTYWSIREVNGLLAKINSELKRTEFQPLTPTALVNSDGTVMNAGQAFSYAASVALGSAATSSQLASTWNQAFPGPVGAAQQSYDPNGFPAPSTVLNLYTLKNSVIVSEPALLSGLSPIGGSSAATSDTYTSTHLVRREAGVGLSTALFEYPAGSGIRLTLEELSQALARDYLGDPALGRAATAGSLGGAYSLVDWFMGAGRFSNGGGFSTFSTFVNNDPTAQAADGLYFFYNILNSTTDWDGSRYLAPGEEIRLRNTKYGRSDPLLSEFTLQQAMFALYWANAGTTPRAWATPTRPSADPDVDVRLVEPIHMAALAQAAKGLTTLTPATVAIGANFSDASVTAVATATAVPAETVLRDQLAEIRRQLAARNPFQATGLALGTSEQARAGSLALGRSIIGNLQENATLLARLSFDVGIGLDEPVWRDVDGQYRSLGEWLDASGLRSRMLQAWPSLATTGLDYHALNRLLVTARELNPSRGAELDFTHPWMQAYAVAGRTFSGSNAVLLRAADSLFAQANLQNKNIPIASDLRVLVDPADPTSTRRLSLDDFSRMFTRLLGADPLPKQPQWYAMDIERAVKTLYAAVQADPPLGAPGRTSSAAITAAELVPFVNALRPAVGASFGPDVFDSRAALFTAQVNGSTVNRSFMDLLLDFSTSTGKDLAPRLESLGILREGRYVQVRGLNELRSWVSTQLPGQVGSAALSATGTPTQVDAGINFAAVIASTSEDAWGLGALQRLTAEWTLVPAASQAAQWPRWQARLGELLAQLDQSTGGPVGLGLDSNVDKDLRDLLTRTVPPQLFPDGPAIQAWLRGLDQNLAATLAELDRNIAHLTQALSNSGYSQATAQAALAARRTELQAQRADFAEARAVASRLLAAGSTVGTFSAALTAERAAGAVGSLRRTDVLAWLDGYDVPAAALSNPSFRNTSAGLDTFDFTLWSNGPNGSSPGTLTSTAALAGLTQAPSAWVTATQPTLAWIDSLVSTGLPRLRQQLAADLTLAQALAAADPANAALATARTAAQARLDRLDALSAAATRLGATRTNPDAFRTALDREAAALGVPDFITELARHDVPAADLANPTYQNATAAVDFFDVTQFWMAGRPGAAGGIDGGAGAAPPQMDQIVRVANQQWLDATAPVLAWVDRVRSRLLAMRQVTDDAVVRLRTAWGEPATPAVDLPTLEIAIDALRQARAEQDRRLAEMDRLLAVRSDAQALQSELQALKAELNGLEVLQVWSAYDVDPASLRQGGLYATGSISGVWAPDLSLAQQDAAAAAPYADDGALIQAYAAWSTDSPSGSDWRTWLSTLVTRTTAVENELAIDQATLLAQRAGVGLSASALEQIDGAQWRVSARLEQVRAARESAQRLAALVDRPADFNAQLELERNRLGRFAVTYFDWASWQSTNPTPPAGWSDALVAADLGAAPDAWASKLAAVGVFLQRITQTHYPALRAELLRTRDAQTALLGAPGYTAAERQALQDAQADLLAQIARLDALTASATRLQAVQADPPAFQARLDTERALLTAAGHLPQGGSGDVLALMATFYVNSAALAVSAALPTSSHFDLGAYWAAKGTQAPAWLADGPTLAAHAAWTVATSPTMTWLEGLRQRIDSTLPVIDDAIVRLQAAWNQPANASLQTDLEQAITGLRQDRALHLTRRGQIERLLAVRDDAEAFPARLVQERALTGDIDLLKALAAYDLTPAQLTGAGTYTQALAGLPTLRYPRFAAARAALDTPPASEATLLAASTAWATATQFLRTGLPALAGRVEAVRADFAASQAALQAQMALPRTTDAERASLQATLHHVQARLQAYERLAAAAARLQGLRAQPAAFTAALAQEREAFSPEALAGFDWSSWQTAGLQGSTQFNDATASAVLTGASSAWASAVQGEAAWLDSLTASTYPTLLQTLASNRQLLQTLAAATVGDAPALASLQQRIQAVEAQTAQLQGLSGVASRLRDALSDPLRFTQALQTERAALLAADPQHNGDVMATLARAAVPASQFGVSGNQELVSAPKVLDLAAFWSAGSPGATTVSDAALTVPNALWVKDIEPVQSWLDRLRARANDAVPVLDDALGRLAAARRLPEAQPGHHAALQAEIAALETYRADALRVIERLDGLLALRQDAAGFSAAFQTERALVLARGGISAMAEWSRWDIPLNKIASPGGQSRLVAGVAVPDLQAEAASAVQASPYPTDTTMLAVNDAWVSGSAQARQWLDRLAGRLTGTLADLRDGQAALQAQSQRLTAGSADRARLDAVAATLEERLQRFEQASAQLARLRSVATQPAALTARLAIEKSAAGASDLFASWADLDMDAAARSSFRQAVPVNLPLFDLNKWALSGRAGMPARADGLVLTPALSSWQQSQAVKPWLDQLQPRIEQALDSFASDTRLMESVRQPGTADTAAIDATLARLRQQASAFAQALQTVQVLRAAPTPQAFTQALADRKAALGRPAGFDLLGDLRRFDVAGTQLQSVQHRPAASSLGDMLSYLGAFDIAPTFLDSFRRDLPSAGQVFSLAAWRAAGSPGAPSVNDHDVVDASQRWESFRTVAPRLQSLESSVSAALAAFETQGSTLRLAQTRGGAADTDITRALAALESQRHAFEQARRAVQALRAAPLTRQGFEQAVAAQRTALGLPAGTDLLAWLARFNVSAADLSAPAYQPAMQGLGDALAYLSSFDVDATANATWRSTVPVTVSTFDLTDWQAAQPNGTLNGGQPRTEADFAAALAAWDDRGGHRNWLNTLLGRIDNTMTQLRADRTRLSQAARADGNDDTAIDARIALVDSTLARFERARQAAVALRNASGSAPQFQAAVTAQSSALQLQGEAALQTEDLLVWLDRFNVDPADMGTAGYRTGGAPIDTFDATKWRDALPASGNALGFNDADVGPSSPASWGTTTSAVTARLAAVEAQAAIAQAKQGWTTSSAAQNAINAALGERSMAPDAPQVSALQSAVAQADRLAQARAEVLRKPLVDTQAEMRSRAFEVGDDGRYYHDAQAVLLRVARALNTLPLTTDEIGVGVAAFADPLVPGQLVSLHRLSELCRQAAGFDLLSLADPSTQRSTWKRDELQFIVHSVNAELGGTQQAPALTASGTAAISIASMVGVAPGQPPAPLSAQTFRSMLREQVLRADLADTVIHEGLRDELVTLLDGLTGFSTADIEPPGVIDFTRLNLSGRSYADLIQEAKLRTGIDVMGLLQTLGIVVDGQYASRDGLNKLLAVVRSELPGRVTVQPLGASSTVTEPARTKTLAEFRAATAQIGLREAALQRLQEQLQGWERYTTLYQRRENWTAWKAELFTLLDEAAAEVGALGLDVQGLKNQLNVDTAYVSAVAGTLGSYVPHTTFFNQVEARTAAVLDHYEDIRRLLMVKRADFARLNTNEGNSRVASIDVELAKVEAQRQPFLQVNAAVNRFLSIVPATLSPAAISGAQLEQLQQAVADFKQEVEAQDVMAYLRTYSVPSSALVGEAGATKAAISIPASGSVTALTESCFNFTLWSSTNNRFGSAATALSLNGLAAEDQYAYLTGALTSASQSDAALLAAGRVPADATWSQVRAQVDTARTGARTALLQAQAQLKLEFADVGTVLSNLRAVEVPGGYEGLWFQVAQALQGVQRADIPAGGVADTVALLEHPPGSGQHVSLRSLLDTVQDQATLNPQRVTLARRLLEVMDLPAPAGSTAQAHRANQLASLSSILGQAAQGGDPLTVLTDGALEMRDLSTDPAVFKASPLTDAAPWATLRGHLQSVVLGDARRLDLARSLQATLAPASAADGLEAGLTSRLGVAIASLQASYQANDWTKVTTRNLDASLRALLTAQEIEQLKRDAKALRNGSATLEALMGSRTSEITNPSSTDSRLAAALADGAGAVNYDWLAALSELRWLHQMRTRAAAAERVAAVNRPEGVNDVLAAVTQGALTEAALNSQGLGVEADRNDLLVHLLQRMRADYATGSWPKELRLRVWWADGNYGVDSARQWSPNPQPAYAVRLGDAAALGRAYAGSSSALANAMVKADGTDSFSYSDGRSLTQTEYKAAIDELEAILATGFREAQSGKALDDALASVVANTRLPEAPVQLSSVFGTNLNLSTLDWNKRETLLSAIRQAMPGVQAALGGAEAPRPDAAGTRAAAAVAERMRTQQAQYEEEVRRTFMATATAVELRQDLTQGGDIYVDRFGSYFINGKRTRAMDLAVTTRVLAHSNFAGEYKVLMDSMAERNNLITGARQFVDRVDQVTTVASSASPPLARAAQAGYDALNTMMGGADWSADPLAVSDAQKSTLRAALGQIASGSADVLWDVTAGRWSFQDLDTLTWTRKQFHNMRGSMLEFIKTETLFEPFKAQNAQVKSSDLLGELTGGKYTSDPAKISLTKSAERMWTLLNSLPDMSFIGGGSGAKGAFLDVVRYEKAERNGGVDVLSLATGGDFTVDNWNSLVAGPPIPDATITTLKTKLAAYINRGVDKPLHYAGNLPDVTNLLNTLISNKVRDNDLDQGKLQSITSQLQVNVEAMTALIKAFNELNSALAQALKR